MKTLNNVTLIFLIFSSVVFAPRKYLRDLVKILTESYVGPIKHFDEIIEKNPTLFAEYPPITIQINSSFFQLNCFDCKKKELKDQQEYFIDRFQELIWRIFHNHIFDPSLSYDYDGNKDLKVSIDFLISIDFENEDGIVIKPLSVNFSCYMQYTPNPENLHIELKLKRPNFLAHKLFDLNTQGIKKLSCDHGEGMLFRFDGSGFTIFFDENFNPVFENLFWHLISELGKL